MNTCVSVNKKKNGISSSCQMKHTFLTFLVVDWNQLFLILPSASKHTNQICFYDAFRFHWVVQCFAHIHMITHELHTNYGKRRDWTKRYSHVNNIKLNISWIVLNWKTLGNLVKVIQRSIYLKIFFDVFRLISVSF